MPRASNRKVWWRCSRDKHHVYEATVCHRTIMHSGCPFCAGQKLSVTNTLAAIAPALAREWHPTKNGTLTPETVYGGGVRRVWWKCDKGPDHEWQDRVAHRTARNTPCPFCVGKRASVTNSLAALFPKVAAEWHRRRNGSLKPADVVAGSKDFAWWRCPLAHTWRGRVRDRTARGGACPVCADAMRL